MATNWQIGELIQNRWQVYKTLKGGMGVIYIVYDHKLHEPFAAKTFQDDAFTRSPVIAGRFMQEALAWVNLDAHQNVAQARFVQIITGKPYLFLEYVSGGDLSSWIGTPRLMEDLPQVIRFAIQFCDGMTHALSKGITAHRDIKPQNCLITQDRTLKVTDFGLAKVFGAAVAEDAATPPPGMSVGLSRTGAVAGTCTHMAPEQFDDAKHVDVRSDIYSFGIMLYQMVTGKLPFEGRSWLEFEQLHKTQRVPPIESKPIELGGIVRQCLAKDPSNRYGRFDEMREELAEMYVKLTGEVAPQPVRGVALDAVKLGNKGISLSALGQTDQALECYERALTVNPRLAGVWSAKGIVLKELRRIDEALACHGYALEFDPFFPNAWCNKGATLLEAGRNEEAINCCERALELDPFYVEAWANKGVALARLERNEEAAACYDRSLELDPRYEKAWHNKGVALTNMRKFEEALACLEQALAVNERYVDAWWGKGSRAYAKAILTDGDFNCSIK
jgi:serine/threonine protein kinase